MFRTLLLLLLPSFLLAQAPIDITNEDIWKDKKFSARQVPGFVFRNDGNHFTRLEDGKIEEYDLRTGEKSRTLFDAETLETDAPDWEGRFDAYEFSADESKVLLACNKKKLFRRSWQAQYFIYDFQQKKLTRLYVGAAQRDACFAPDGLKVGFVTSNDLFYLDLRSGETVRVTNDGNRNRIINGASDWVYEEEFRLVRAFEWSPDSKYIAYLRFDESDVKSFTMGYYNNKAYPLYHTFKYPKVGEKNARVSAHIFALSVRETNQIEVRAEYMPRILWTPAGSLCLTTLNRHQNLLQLWLTNPRTGKTNQLLEEKSQYYLELQEPVFLEDESGFVWLSERSGYRHLYLIDMRGREKKALTRGNFEVSQLHGVDDAEELLYYQAAGNKPMQRELYSVKLNGRGSRKISDEPGYHDATFSNNFELYIDKFSTINKPPVYTVRDRKGKLVRTIEDNAEITALQEKHGTFDIEFLEVPVYAAEGPGEERWSGKLNGWILRPKGPEYDNKPLPLLMFVYGGPGSQQVVDGWKGDRYWWFQMLARQGYAIACVDNRGTGGRGEFFKKQTYLQLGKYETIDQIAAAKFFGKQDYIDAGRIGIFGWSYGGYLSSLCMLKGGKVFNSGIAVAPVTHWKWYDNIYTERYMRTETENPDGYADNAPVNLARNLKGKYLLVHGLLDDNVHFQHSAEMANALIAANKQFDSMIYPNRAHSIRDRDARFHLYTLMSNFLHENLKAETVRP